MNIHLQELAAESPEGLLYQVKIGDHKPTQKALGLDKVNDN